MNIKLLFALILLPFICIGQEKKDVDGYPTNTNSFVLVTDYDSVEQAFNSIEQILEKNKYPISTSNLDEGIIITAPYSTVYYSVSRYKFYICNDEGVIKVGVSGEYYYNEGLELNGVILDSHWAPITNRGSGDTVRTQQFEAFIKFIKLFHAKEIIPMSV